MRKYNKIIALTLVLCIISQFESFCENGYVFSSNKSYTKVKFKFIDDLIVIPVKVNEKMLNLILDTGIRNMVLFGKRYEKFINTNIEVVVGGWGNTINYKGGVSANNQITIGDIQGKGISFVVINSQFSTPIIKEADGIMGYQLFSKFPILIDYQNQILTIFNNNSNPKLVGFIDIPIKIVDTKPYLKSSIEFKNGEMLELYLLFDTGASITVILNTFNNFGISPFQNKQLLGYGLSGEIKGRRFKCENITIGPLIFKNIDLNITNNTSNVYRKKTAKGLIGNKLFRNSKVLINYSDLTLSVKSFNKSEFSARN